MPDMFCDECKHLVPKEDKQTKKKEHHICKRYNKILFHAGFHPRIPRCEECFRDNGKNNDLGI